MVANGQPFVVGKERSLWTEKLPCVRRMMNADIEIRVISYARREGRNTTRAIENVGLKQIALRRAVAQEV